MSSSWTPPAPPAQTVWWVVADTKAAVLAKLRLASADIDAARVEALVPVAGYKINERLDRDGTVPLTAQQIAVNKTALETLVIALYMPPVRNPDGSYVDPLKSITLAGRTRRGVG